MFIPRPDASHSEPEWRAFVEDQGFGHLVCSGRGRDVPIVAALQYVLAGDRVLAHLAAPNPLWKAAAENDKALLSVAGDWAYIPAAWKAVEAEDPALGIPTTYYAAVQLLGAITVVDDDDGKLDILRALYTHLEPDSGHADPGVHAAKLSGIRGVSLRIEQVRAKFKYGGNVDAPHREAVADRLAERGGAGDIAARRHLLRRHPL